MLLNVSDGLLHQKVSGLLLALRLLRLRGLLRRKLIQMGLHGRQRLVDLVHLRGLQQEPRHAKADRLLSIGEIPVTGQHRHLHVRELTAQRRQHGQAVGSGHADVGEQDMGLQFPDQRRAFLGAAGRSHDLAAVVRPLDDPPQAFHNDIFIVNENYPIHRIRSFFFLPGHAAPA